MNMWLTRRVILWQKLRVRTSFALVHIELTKQDVGAPFLKFLKLVSFTWIKNSRFWKNLASANPSTIKGLKKCSIFQLSLLSGTPSLNSSLPNNVFLFLSFRLISFSTDFSRHVQSNCLAKNAYKRSFQSTFSLLLVLKVLYIYAALTVECTPDKTIVIREWIESCLHYNSGPCIPWCFIKYLSFLAIIRCRVF